MSGWVLFGLLSQALFVVRFVAQRRASHAAGCNTVPASYWWLGLAGCAGLLAYAVYRADPVFIVSQLGALCVMGLNLHFFGARRPAATHRAEPTA